MSQEQHVPNLHRYFLVDEDRYRVQFSYDALQGSVEVWNGDRWVPSVLPDLATFLDDALGSGATVREIEAPE